MTTTTRRQTTPGPETEDQTQDQTRRRPDQPDRLAQGRASDPPVAGEPSNRQTVKTHRNGGWRQETDPYERQRTENQLQWSGERWTLNPSNRQDTGDSGGTLRGDYGGTTGSIRDLYGGTRGKHGGRASGSMRPLTIN